MESSDTKASHPLAINLFNAQDDEEDLFLKKLLTSLVEGAVPPSQAASTLDKRIVETSNREFEQRKSHSDPWNVPSPSDPDSSWAAPNPDGTISLFFESFARLCSVYPPGHVGQDRLIQFLESLREMPRHVVPSYLPNDPPEPYYYMLDLWPFGDSWLALTEVFRMTAEDCAYPNATFAVPGSDMQVGWRNWQSALARITARGFVDCSFLCALEGILPQPKTPSASRVSGDVIGGVQWILQADTGRYIYEQCQAVPRLLATDSRAMWSWERWEQWKEQLGSIAGDDKYFPEAQKLAKLAVERMEALEAE